MQIPSHLIKLGAEFQADQAWWEAFSLLGMHGGPSPLVVSLGNIYVIQMHQGLWGWRAVWQQTWFQRQWGSLLQRGPCTENQLTPLSIPTKQTCNKVEQTEYLDFYTTSVPAAGLSDCTNCFCGTVVTPTVLQLSKVIPFSCLPLTRGCTRLQRHLSKCPLSSAAPGRPEETKSRAKNTRTHHSICPEEN